MRLLLLAMTALTSLVVAACAGGPVAVRASAQTAEASAPAGSPGGPVPVPDEPGTAPGTRAHAEERPSGSAGGDATTVSPVDDPPGLAAEEDRGWDDHPLAVHVPRADELGDEWTITSSRVTEYAAAEPNEELATCGLAPPPTLEGIEVSYTAGLEYDHVVSFVVVRGTVADVEQYLALFRALPACDPDVLGFSGAAVEITGETIDVDGSDDAVHIRVAATSTESDLGVDFVVARSGRLLFAMTAGSLTDGEPADPLPVDEMVAIIERSAARS